MHLWVCPAVGQREEVYVLPTTTCAFTIYTEVQWQRTHAPAGHPTVAQRTHAHSMHLTIITSPPGRSQGLNKIELTSTPPWLPWPSSLAISPEMEGYWNTLSQSLEVVDRTRSRQRRVWMRVAQSFKFLLAASLIFNFKSPAWEVPRSLP